jgi:exodeoxyribonuclease V beta subunit
LALQQQDIPFTFHKKKKLYQSIEAIHFHVLLTALARPDELKRVNNALLTLFFGLQPTQLRDFADEQLPAINNLWLKTKEAVVAKDWIKVFDLVLNESGALFRARKNSRRIANIKQLKQQLLKAALQNNLGADALLKFYQQKREQSSNDEDLHHKDTEQKSVKIMTMHISKGLEFPVVFLFGGFVDSNKDSFLQYYDEKQQGMVFDLVKKHQTIYQEQQLKAAHQLYYVAMTRAIFMLFLPFVDETDKKINSPGLYVKTVMARLKATGMYQLTPPEPVGKRASSIESIQSIKAPPTFNLKVPEDLNSRRRHLHSFSSLSRLKNHTSQTATVNDFSQSLTAELMNTEARVDQSVITQLGPQMPGGVKTGHVLHGIFEHVDFKLIAGHDNKQSVYQDELIMAVIDQQMKLFKLDNKVFDVTADQTHLSHFPLDYRQQLADWTWHSLKKPLEALNGKNLASIDQTNRCHELSFFWNHGPTHLTGFIDLFFAVSNVDSTTDYYILDWKSNFSPNGYSPSVLADEVMTQHQYHWQYQLYAMALQSWFDALHLKNARLKGAIYVFSRGMDSQEKHQNGVFYDDFSTRNWQIDDIKTELLKIDQFGVKS